MDTFPKMRSWSDRASAAILMLLAIVVLYAFTTIIYRLFFHPLRRFPGPKLNAISSLPSVLWTIRGRMPMNTRRLHDRYGSVIRLSPNELSFNSAQAWTDIYGHRVGRRDYAKDPIHVGAVDPVPGASTISMADHANHARQRKALSYGFSKKALWEQEGIMQEYVTKLMTSFWGFADRKQSFDVVKWFNLIHWQQGIRAGDSIADGGWISESITFDVIGDLAFGESFDCLDDGEFHWWIPLIFDAVKAGALEQATRRFATPGSPTQNYLMKWIPNQLRERRRDHLAYSRSKVMKRIETRTDRKDFTHYIMKQAEHYDLSQDEIVVNAALFIVAGSETTASSLSSMVNHLVRHTEVYGRLVAEIRGSFAAEEEITLEKCTNELPYLNACLEENLRVFPPAPVGFLRSVNEGGDVIDGHAVPGGMSVSVSSWCASHSETNFRDCDSFIPERWLDEKKYSGDRKLASRPFSMGPRGCIGRDMSYMEMRLVLARMLFNFDIEGLNLEAWNPEGEYKNMKAYSTWQKPELQVVLTPVKRA